MITEQIFTTVKFSNHKEMLKHLHCI